VNFLNRQSPTISFSGPHKFPDFDAKIQRLKDMGVSEFEARAALSRNNWDLNRATEQLFS
jgi:ubiquitin-conjugating enzyme (huntingtin interacting protein 2)